METWVVIMGLLLALGLVTALGWRWGRSDGAAPTEATAYRELISRCQGDREVVERLIAGEQARAPDLGRGEAIARALLRLERDRKG